METQIDLLHESHDVSMSKRTLTEQSDPLDQPTSPALDALQAQLLLPILQICVPESSEARVRQWTSFFQNPIEVDGFEFQSLANKNITLDSLEMCWKMTMEYRKAAFEGQLFPVEGVHSEFEIQIEEEEEDRVFSNPPLMRTIHDIEKPLRDKDQKGRYTETSEEIEMTGQGPYTDLEIGTQRTKRRREQLGLAVPNSQASESLSERSFLTNQ